MAAFFRSSERAMARRVAPWLASAALGGMVVLWTLDPAHRPGAAEGNDFLVYYEAAAGFGLTGNPYGTGFVSPAPFALLLRPIVALAPGMAAIAWYVASLLAVIGLSGASLHLAGRPPWPPPVLTVATLVFFWPANNYGLLLGQNTALVAWFSTLAIVAVGQRPSAAGALLGLGAVAKPHLVLPLALGLAADDLRRTRRPRLAMAFLLTATGLFALTALFSRRWIGVLLEGPPESWNYWGSTVGANVFLSVLSQDRLAGWVTWAVVSAALIGTAIVWWWRSAPSSAELGSALLAMTLLVTPYAYPHDYVLLTLPLVWVVLRVDRTFAQRLPVGLLLGLAAWFGPMPALYDDRRFAALIVPVLLLGLAWAVPAMRHRVDVTTRQP